MSTLLKIGLRLVLLIVLVLAAANFVAWLGDRLEFSLTETARGMSAWAVALTVLLYVLLLAIPFVPGAEIGLVLLTVFGAAIAPLVWLATVAALALAYFAGRWIGPDWLCRILLRIGWTRAAALLRRDGGKSERERLAALLEGIDARIVPVLLRNRYLALIVLVNTPGNIVIGGGGGLSLVAGSSRLFSPLLFLASVALATLPVPLSVMAWGP